MITPISPSLTSPIISPVGPNIPAPGTGASGSEDTFVTHLSNALHDVQSTQTHADEALKNFMSGKGGDIHQVMLAMEQARLSMMVVVEMRNKLVDAYQELSRMPV